MYLVKISTTATNKTFGAQKSKSTKEIQQSPYINVSPNPEEHWHRSNSCLLLTPDDWWFEISNQNFKILKDFHSRRNLKKKHENISNKPWNSTGNYDHYYITYPMKNWCRHPGFEYRRIDEWRPILLQLRTNISYR